MGCSSSRGVAEDAFYDAGTGALAPSVTTSLPEPAAARTRGGIRFSRPSGAAEGPGGGGQGGPTLSHSARAAYLRSRSHSGGAEVAGAGAGAGAGAVSPSSVGLRSDPLSHRAAHDTFTYIRRMLKLDRRRRQAQTDPTDDIIAKYHAHGKLSSAEVQTLFRSTFNFTRTVETYEGVCRIMLHRGEPLMACDILNTATKLYPDSGVLRKLRGLALAQAGNTTKAMKLLEALTLEEGPSEETEGVLARCYKDLAGVMGEYNGRGREELYTKAYEIYRRSYEAGKKTSYYTGINTATMALLLGREVEATTIAAEVTVACEAAQRKLGSGRKQAAEAYWILATLGEASVIQGNFDKAVAYYTEAAAQCPKAYGKFASSLRQLKLLLGHLNSGRGEASSRRLKVASRMRGDMDGYAEAVLRNLKHRIVDSGLTASEGDLGGPITPLTPLASRGASERLSSSGSGAGAGAGVGVDGGWRHDADASVKSPPRDRRERSGVRSPLAMRVHRRSASSSLHVGPSSGDGVGAEADPFGSGSAAPSTPGVVRSRSRRKLELEQAGPSTGEVDLAAELVHEKVRRACARVMAAMAERKPTDEQFIKVISFEMLALDGEAAATHDQGKPKPLHRAVVQSAIEVAEREYGLVMSSPSGRFSHAAFQRIFKLPTVLALISAATHENVVPMCAGEPTLRRQFEAVLDRTEAGFAFASPVSPQDIIFLEVVHERGGEIWLVLPVPQPVLEAHMLHECAKIRQPADSPLSQEAYAEQWISRLRALLGVAAKVDVSNSMSPEMTSTNTHYCGMVLYGLANMKAKKLGVSVERVFLKAMPSEPTTPSDVLPTPTNGNSPFRRTYADSAARRSSQEYMSDSSRTASSHLEGVSERSHPPAVAVRARSPGGGGDSGADESKEAPSSTSAGGRSRSNRPSLVVVTDDDRGSRRRSSPALQAKSSLALLPPRAIRAASTSFAEESDTPASLLTPREVSAFGTPRTSINPVRTSMHFFPTTGTVPSSPDTSPSSPKPAASPHTSHAWFVTPLVVEQWERQGLPFRVLFYPAEVLSTKKRHSRFFSLHALDAELDPTDVETHEADVVALRKPRQVVMAILFADIVGYSKLSEFQVLAFVENFLVSVRDMIERLPTAARPVVKNTWGDAFYFVFTRVGAAGDFALNLTRLVHHTNWARFGLPTSLSIRVSLHAAPVFIVTDPIIGQRNYTGVHTSMAARIEPITPPGQVYCSQAFAAMSEAVTATSIECTYVGNVPLAKSYGLQKVYHVRRPEGFVGVDGHVHHD